MMLGGVVGGEKRRPMHRGVLLCSRVFKDVWEFVMNSHFAGVIMKLTRHNSFLQRKKPEENTARGHNQMKWNNGDEATSGEGKRGKEEEWGEVGREKEKVGREKEKVGK